MKLKRIRFILWLYNKDFMTGFDLFKGQLKEHNAVIVIQSGKPVTVSVMAWATWSDRLLVKLMILRVFKNSNHPKVVKYL